MSAVCQFCLQSPREGDNMRSVRVVSGQPHFADLLVRFNEPPEQTSITVPVCFDCCREYSQEYFGLPPEALGDRPSWPKSRECVFCGLPYRQGEYAALIRVLPEDGEWWEKVAEEGQPSVCTNACGSCRAAYWPLYAPRLGLDPAAPVQSAPKHLV